MKMGKRVLASLLLWLPFFSIAQCVSPLSTVSFDSTVTGSGNSFHTFTFPRFDAALGTLVDIRIRTEVTLGYRFQLENRESIAINNYRVRVVRDDEISGIALQTPITYTQQVNYGPYALAASDGAAGSGTDYISVGPMYVMDHETRERAVYNTADFLGAGNISLDYTASTYSIVFGSVNYNYNGTAEDTVRITVTYRYCSTWFLPADITIFTAVKKNEQVTLRWMTANEKNNRNYTLEKSSDGKNFQPVTNLRSFTGNNDIGDYEHNYIPAGNEWGKMIFRIKQTESDGTVKYSGLRVVDIGKRQENKILLYPNPSNGNFNLLFHKTKRDDWKVEILTITGQVLRQFDFNRALVGKINLQNELSAGSYLVRIIHKKTREQSVQSLIVR